MQPSTEVIESIKTSKNISDNSQSEINVLTESNEEATNESENRIVTAETPLIFTPPSPLTRLAIVKEHLRIALPMTGVSILDTLNIFGSGLILSKLKNSNALAISPLVDATDLTLTTVSMAPLHAIGILTRELKGKGRNFTPDIGGVWQQSLLLATATALPTMLLMRYGLTPVYSLIGQSEELTQLVQTYFDAYFWGVLPNALVGCSEQLAFGTDRQRLVFGMRIFELSVLALASYALVFGGLGMPALGVQGLGYAFATQAWLSLVAYTSWLFFRKEFGEYGLFRRHPNLTFGVLRQLWSVGWPMGLAAINDLSSIFAISMLIGRLGKASLIAQEIAAAYFTLLIEPVFAIARGTSWLVSESFGAKRFTDMRNFGNTGLQMGTLIALLGFTFAAFPKLLASAFIDVDDPSNAEALSMLRPLLALTATNQLIDSVRSVTFGALSGLAGDTLIPSLIGSLGTWAIGMPLAYCLGFPVGLGLNGLLLGTGVGLLTSTAPTFYRWYKRSNHPESIKTDTTQTKSNYCPAFFSKKSEITHNVKHSSWWDYCPSFFNRKSNHPEQSSLILPNQLDDAEQNNVEGMTN